MFAPRPSMDARLLLALGRCARRLFSGPPRRAWGCHGAPEFPQIHDELGSRQSPGTAGLSCDFVFMDRPRAAFLPLHTFQLLWGSGHAGGRTPAAPRPEGLSALLRETAATSPHARGPRWNQPVLLPCGCRLTCRLLTWSPTAPWSTWHRPGRRVCEPGLRVVRAPG